MCWVSKVVMDKGWIGTLASPKNPTPQLNIIGSDPALPHPDYSVEVADVGECYQRTRKKGRDILYPLTARRDGASDGFLLATRTAGSPVSCNAQTACQLTRRNPRAVNSVGPLGKPETNLLKPLPAGYFLWRKCAKAPGRSTQMN